MTTTASEVFSKIVSHLIEGMMLHDRMADYYDFLGLMGFKRLHEYHYLCDAVELRGVHRYYINHFNMLIPEQNVVSPWSIPSSWFNYERQSVGAGTKKASVQSGVEAWAEWEHNTKKLYEQCYCDLCDIGEVAAACKVKELISDADMECKCADRLHIRLKGMEYDMPAIFMMQDEMHEEYDKKEKEVGVSIC